MVAPGPAWATLEAALRERRPVRLSYHGRLRTVCPHALGWKNGKAMLLAYQIGGQTGSLSADPRQRWRNLFVHEIDHVDAADPSSRWETADNYNPAHPFNAIDHLSIAVVPNDSPARVR
ncbi:MAG: WYL domain-containing protein [Actinobacteria bacterium]|nr:WYL domain-containing protein [Actinomycetota bacterium]